MDGMIHFGESDIIPGIGATQDLEDSTASDGVGEDTIITGTILTGVGEVITIIGTTHIMDGVDIMVMRHIIITQDIMDTTIEELLSNLDIDQVHHWLTLVEVRIEMELEDHLV